MSKRDIVVIGASAGGVEALMELVSQFPTDLKAAIFIVLHVPADYPSQLPEILQRCTNLPVRFGRDGEEIRLGRIYVGLPDHHLMLDEHGVRITRGPKENRFRPAVDTLFRSAALYYGPRVIGVILTGALDDGASGLYGIKERNGLCVVQHPEDAKFPSMPLSALRTVQADYVLPLAEMGTVLTQLTSQGTNVGEESLVSPEKKPVSPEMDSEVGIALGDNGRMREIMGMGEFTPFTCPECHGSLIALKQGSLLRFRCHTGHAFTLNSLMAELTEHTEDTIMSALRAVEETELLMSHMKRHLEENGQPEIAQRLIPKIKQAEKRAALIKQAAIENEVISQDLLEGI